MFTPEQYEHYKETVVAKWINNRLFVSWAAKASGIECILVGPETRCFCQHRCFLYFISCYYNNFPRYEEIYFSSTRPHSFDLKISVLHLVEIIFSKFLVFLSFLSFKINIKQLTHSYPFSWTISSKHRTHWKWLVAMKFTVLVSPFPPTCLIFWCNYSSLTISFCTSQFS